MRSIGELSQVAPRRTVAAMESFHVENGDHQFEMANLLKEPSSSLRSISPTKLQTASLVTLTVILIGFALHWLRPVLVPLVIAVAVSYVFIPILDLLTSNLKFPKSVAVLVTLAFGSSVFGFLLWLVVSSVRQITSKHNMKLYEKAVNNLFVKTNSFFERLVHKGGLVENAVDAVQDLPAGEMVLGFGNEILKMLIELSELGFLVLIFTIYILQAYKAKTTNQPRVGQMAVIESRIKKYLFIKTCLSILMGLSAGLILLLLGVKYVGLVILLNFLFNYIPNVGPTIATLVPIPFMILAEFNWFPIVMAIILPTVAHLVIGSIIEPNLMGNQLELHPITVMLGLIFWGMLWGLPGMFMSAPLTALCRICFESVDFTAPVARLLAGDLGSFSEKLETE